MRSYHVLSKNHRNSIPTRIIFYDTETFLIPDKENPDITKHKFMMVSGCFVRITKDIEREEWITTKKLEEFHQWILKHSFSKTRLYVIAHNQNYDMIVAKIFPFFEDEGFKIKLLVIDSGKIIISFVKGSKTIVFLDSLNWFKFPLKVLGESIGIEKLEMPKQNDSDEKWNEYNRNDVVILKKYFLNYLMWLQKNDMGNFGFTLPSQSFNAFRHRFMKFPIHIHNDENAIKLERMSYHGARTDCFRIGEYFDKIYDLDVNSMYPSVMVDERYPTRLIGKLYTLEPESIYKKIQDGYCVIVKVYVNTDIPVFCFKNKNNKLIFPTGRFETVLTTKEFEFAYENNLIEKVIEGNIYDSEYLFLDFVRFMYGKRQESKKNCDIVGTQFYKLILNSLYGKFGQQIQQFQEFDGNGIIPSGSGTYFDTVKNKRKSIKYINEQSFIETEKEESYNSFCAIASHVTANARMLLWKYISIAKTENVFYCDTDSIFTNETGHENLKEYCDENKLGLLKLENTENYLKINGLKDYVLGDMVRLKGISLKNSKQLSKNKYEITIWRKLRSMINKKNLSEYYTEKSSKTLQRNYDKGIVLDSGIVKPIHIV